MDKEIEKELERMVLENKYEKTLDFAEVKCSKCANSLSGACNIHYKNKINMLKEVMLKNLPESAKEKNHIALKENQKGSDKLTINKFVDSNNFNYFNSQGYQIFEKKNNLIDITGKKCKDVSEMEFSFDDVFES